MWVHYFLLHSKLRLAHEIIDHWLQSSGVGILGRNFREELHRAASTGHVRAVRTVQTAGGGSDTAPHGSNRPRLQPMFLHGPPIFALSLRSDYGVVIRYQICSWLVTKALLRD